MEHLGIFRQNRVFGKDSLFEILKKRFEIALFIFPTFAGISYQALCTNNERLRQASAEAKLALIMPSEANLCEANVSANQRNLRKLSNVYSLPGTPGAGTISGIPSTLPIR